MNKKMVGGVALEVLIGSVAIWLSERESAESVSTPPVADPRPQFEATPVPEPTAASSAPAEEKAMQDVMPIKAPGQIFPTDQSLGAGYYIRPVTKELEIYLQVVDAAVYSEFVNGKMAQEQLLRNMQAQLEITDNELEQLIEVARPILDQTKPFKPQALKKSARRGTRSRLWPSLAPR